jgi:methylated-DNA-[protein]-cysteine S-methyltransferase
MWTVMDSPIGELRIVEHDGAITAIEFTPFRDHDGRPRGARATTTRCSSRPRASCGVLRPRPQGVRPAARTGRHDFQQRVWAQLLRIGYGETASYGEIAHRLGKTNAASRAVGLANGRNPIPIVIPCHRVIGADGTLTGYAGGLERKQTLLELEQDALF